MTMLPAVILAGGQARRMGGGDKGLLRLGGGTLLDHVIGRIERQAAPLALNANGDPTRFAGFGLPVLPDSVAGFPGPLAGILAGLDWAAGLGAPAVISVAADTPFLPASLVQTLSAAATAEGTPIALAATMEGGKLRRHPTFGLWPTALREDLRTAIQDGTRKVVAWTDGHGAASAVFDPAEDPFFNVNTPDDLAEARARLEALPG